MHIGLLGAMTEEVAELVVSMTDTSTRRIGLTEFHEGQLEGQHVVLAYSGIGKVNAAVAVQMMVDHFNVDVLIFTGIAGGVDPTLQVGDIVISEDSVQYDFDSSAFGYDRGLIPRIRKKLFYADRTLIVRFLGAAARIREQQPDLRFRLGRVLTGDRFVADADQNQELFSRFYGQCVEMEGAAAAQVCYLNQVPYVIIRTISDRADHSAKVDFRTFAAEAVEKSCGLVRQVLRNWDGKY